MSRTDRLIASTTGWGAFWDALVGEQPALQGDAFERVTQLYLQSHPEYRAQLKHVWRVPGEVPPRIRTRLNLPSSDEGIDLVAETNEGKFWAIQCKFRSDTKKPLTYGELSTFTSLAFVTCRHISLAVVAHTCSKPVRKHQYLGNATEIGLDRWLGLTDEDWEAIQGRIGGKALSLTPRKPRPHQKNAIQAAMQHFSAESRGRMIMPCGTGKSLTAFWVAQALDAKLIVVAVPSLALIRQSLLDWTREYLAHGEVPQWLVICSDESTAKLDRDEFVGDTYDLGIPTTTRVEEIVPFLRKRTGRRIIFTTYQSSGTFAKAVKKAGTKLDLAILDEAHKTVGVKSKAFACLLSDANIVIGKRVFMTATERVVYGNSDDVFSMDDEAVYGKRFYQLTFKDAIAQRIISDYRVLTITVSDNAVRDLVVENRLIELTGDETAAHTLAAAVALRRAVNDHSVLHALSFHGSIRAASAFRDLQELLNDAFVPSLTSLHVSSKKTAGERDALMREFKSAERALMTNARCLTEGVDVPAIDCVLFADPKQSVIDIVQAAGRALRPHPNKQYGYILLPLVVPSSMDVETFADTTEFKQVARTITALSTQDERIAEQFRIVEHGRLPTSTIVEFEGDVPVGVKISFEDFSREIGVRLWERVGRANWRAFEDARQFVHGLRLKSNAQWVEYSKSGLRPPDIPAAPHLAYKDSGWTTLGDWLGTGVIASRLRDYRPFEQARGFVRGLGLRSGAAWKVYCKSGQLPDDIPANPNQTYKKKGWAGIGDWIGTGTIATYRRKYLSYEDARNIVRSLGLTRQSDWYAYLKSGRLPSNIPSSPSVVYRDSGWVGFGDWLGTGTLATRRRKYLAFDDAKRFARSLCLSTVAEWYAFTKSGKLPKDVPANPNQVYRRRGWTSFGDWLGNGNVAARARRYLPFPEARAFVRNLNLRTGAEWDDYCKSGKLPPNIPAVPRHAYKGKGWKSMGDWLGTGRLANYLREYRPFHEAREFARSLNLGSSSEWFSYCKTKERPHDIPSNPRTVYKGKGWISFGDWLGTGIVATFRQEYLPFIKARAYARRLKLKSRADWESHCRSGKLPHNIPKAPEVVYREKGWVSVGDWLGTGNDANQFKKFLPFASARKVARSLKLASQAEWHEMSRAGKRPPGLPSNPDKAYRDKGWKGYGDWLGNR